MFHVRLTRYLVMTKDVTNLDGPTLLGTFVNPWLAGEPMVWDGRRYDPANTKLTIYEGPPLTTFQQGFGAWMKVMEYGEDVTDALLAERHVSITIPDGASPATLPPAPTDGSTASRRSPTGLDAAGRDVMLQALEEAGVPPAAVLASFLRDGAFSGTDDYLRAVDEAWGGQEAAALNAAPDQPPDLLLAMPEPDFLTAVELAARSAPDPYQRAGGLAARLNQICERRGAHVRLGGVPARFAWTGDPVTASEVVAPALEALGDPRLASGAGAEYAAARAELRVGTPAALKQAVVESCNAVESAMKVLADEHSIARTGQEGAQKLFELLRDSGVIDAATEMLVLAPARFGNRRGRHGSGAVAHDVAADEAEAIVRAAAVAITFLAARLSGALHAR